MKIEHIDEVLPHVSGRPDFVVAKRDGYTVVDYVFSGPDTFDHPVRLECRGLKFGPDGRTLARPFAKFFNIGEKEQTQAHLIDMTKPHVIMEKLDGSMIHPAIVDGALVFMTRMGRTDVAKRAEALITPEIEAACRAALVDMGVTPIFEFTAPQNRIIIRYDRPQLHLLALRETISGAYLPFELVRPNALRMGVEPVPFVPSSWATSSEFVAYARTVQGMEGFVVRFADGLWIKMKGDDYVLKHRSKDQISLEKNAALRSKCRKGTDERLGVSMTGRPGPVVSCLRFVGRDRDASQPGGRGSTRDRNRCALIGSARTRAHSKRRGEFWASNPEARS